MSEAITRETLLAWLRERRGNCYRLAEHKEGADKRGWLEDAEYFKAAINAIDELRG